MIMIKFQFMNVLEIKTKKEKHDESKIRDLKRRIGKMSIERQKLINKGIFLAIDLTGNYMYDFAIKSCSRNVRFPLVYSFCSFNTYEEALYYGLIEAKRKLKEINISKNNKSYNSNVNYDQISF